MELSQAAYGNFSPKRQASVDLQPAGAQSSFPSGNLSPARIKVIGVGGGGCNAVNRMIDQGLHGVEFIAVNTDAQALGRAQTPNRVHIGDMATRGLGAGGVPEMGRKAAEESEAALIRMLEGADMIFVTAGLGGGTGTGAAPVVARLARTVGALTIGIVTLPFSFEGKRRIANAEWGISQLKDQVDTLIVIPNDRLLQVVDTRATLNSAFRAADDVLYQGIQSISELITEPGLINLDFADVRTIMQGGGAALMSIGIGKGEQRARQAAEGAISNPLLDVTINGAQGVLLNILAGSDVTLYEVNEAASIVREVAHPDANVIFGAVIDPELKDEMRISIIATGFARASETQASEEPAQAVSQSIPVRLSPPVTQAVLPQRHAAHPQRQDASSQRQVVQPQRSASTPPFMVQPAENSVPLEDLMIAHVAGDAPYSTPPAQAQPSNDPAVRSSYPAQNEPDSSRGYAQGGFTQIIGYPDERDSAGGSGFSVRNDFTPRIVNTNDLDVPTFLRNRIKSRS